MITSEGLICVIGVEFVSGETLLSRASEKGGQWEGSDLYFWGSQEI